MGKKLAEKITSKTDYKGFLGNKQENSFYLSPVTEADIVKEINNLKDTAGGDDGIKPRMLKTAKETLAKK